MRGWLAGAIQTPLGRWDGPRDFEVVGRLADAGEPSSVQFVTKAGATEAAACFDALRRWVTLAPMWTRTATGTMDPTLGAPIKKTGAHTLVAFDFTTMKQVKRFDFDPVAPVHDLENAMRVAHEAVPLARVVFTYARG